MDVETLFCPLLLEAAAAYAVMAGPPISPRTLQWWHAALLDLDRALGSGRAVDNIGHHEIEDWHAHLLRRVSPVTANNNLRAVRGVFARLVRAGYLADNPAALVSYAPQPPHRPQAVTEATYRALLAVANPRDAALVALLWATGCRVGELTTMELKGLELWQEAGCGRLAAFVVGKHHRRLSIDHAGRYVYAEGETVELARRWLMERPAATTDALFPDRTGTRPAPVATLHSAFRLLRQRAVLPAAVVANPHAFRHAFAYRKRREGYPLEWISEWLGHSDPAFTAKMYGDKSEPEVRRRFFAPPPGRR